MRQLSIQRAAVIILFGLLFALAARFPTDTDTWWHLRSAEYTLQNGIIYSDPFSFTKAGEPWINHSWGAQIMLYGFWLIAGNLGLSHSWKSGSVTVYGATSYFGNVVRLSSKCG